MRFAVYSDKSTQRRKVSWLFLAFFWILGISFGIWISFRADPFLFSGMRMAVFSPVSIVGLLSAAMLPFLFSAFAVFASCLRLLYILNFLDGLFYGLLFCAAAAICPVSGWMLRLLLCFSMFAVTPLSYWFRLRHVSGERKFALAELIWFLTSAAMVGGFDYFCISPFLARLIS